MDKFPTGLATALVVGSVVSVPVLGWGAVVGALIAVGVFASIIRKL